MRFTAACLQLTSGHDVTANIEAVDGMVRRAKMAGAEFVTLPENALLMEESREALLAKAYVWDGNPLVARMQKMAQTYGVWLLVGSLPVLTQPGAEKVANTSVLIAPSGEVAARYTKIHLFDVALGAGDSSGGRYQESARCVPGDRAVTVATPWGRLGMTVCYDVRFPHLYRALAKGGAEMLAVPSAFTRLTGEAHWHVLLRARAIENGCFVIAPAQCGEHPNTRSGAAQAGRSAPPGKRQTFGHSLIIDPWGEVLADGGDAPGVVLADIDMARVAECRRRIPSLQHDREFTVQEA